MRSTATKALIVAFKELDVILQRCDGIVESVRLEERDFANTYDAARMIIDLGIRHKKKTEEEQDGGTKDGGTKNDDEVEDTPTRNDTKQQ